MENFNILVSGGYQAEDLVGDGWTEIFRNLTGMLPPEGFEALAKEKLGLATAGNSSETAKMVGMRLPMESHVLQAFVSEGASVVLANRSEEKGANALARLDAGDRAVFKKTDALVCEQVEELIGVGLERAQYVP